MRSDPEPDHSVTGKNSHSPVADPNAPKRWWVVSDPFEMKAAMGRVFAEKPVRVCACAVDMVGQFRKQAPKSPGRTRLHRRSGSSSSVKPAWCSASSFRPPIAEFVGRFCYGVVEGVLRDQFGEQSGRKNILLIRGELRSLLECLFEQRGHDTAPHSVCDCIAVTPHNQRRLRSRVATNAQTYASVPSRLSETRTPECD